MKLIVFTDIHSNLPALTAIHKAIMSEGFDLVIHTGDAVDIGPFPSETLDLLREIRSIEFVRGNHENFVLKGSPEPLPNWMDTEQAEHIMWTKRQLRDDQIRLIEKWPYSLTRRIEGVDIMFIHYGMNEEQNRWIKYLANPDGDAMDKMFVQYKCDLVFFGHDHAAIDVQGRARYINPGSAGCYSKPLARYCTVNLHQGQYQVDHKTVPYDLSSVHKELQRRQVPAREFITRVFMGGKS